MPTYRFPDAVKKGNIPFSHGRDYKPVLGLDRLEKKERSQSKNSKQHSTTSFCVTRFGDD